MNEAEKVELPIHYAELESIYSQTIDRGIRSLAVTCCSGKEGTTTVATALARRAEAGGRKTLLVDMNFCSPAIGLELGLESRQWKQLDNYLSDQIEQLPANDAWVSSLSVLPAPSTPTGNLMLREKNFLSECMKAWLQEYELVIIDTSPINAINRHNLPAERICAQCEGTLLTVMSGITQQSHIHKAMQKLDSNKVELSGCIMNDMHFPTLSEELVRQSYKLQPWFPGLMTWLRNKIQRSSMLNMTI